MAAGWLIEYINSPWVVCAATATIVDVGQVRAKNFNWKIAL